MPANFDLIITADYQSRMAELRLLNSHGGQITFRQTDFKTIALSHQHGLFDLRNYQRHYSTEGEEAACVAEIGLRIAKQLLGEGIFRHCRASDMPFASTAPSKLARCSLYPTSKNCWPIQLFVL
jgi:hypothetical protein